MTLLYCTPPCYYYAVRTMLFTTYIQRDCKLGVSEAEDRLLDAFLALLSCMYISAIKRQRFDSSHSIGKEMVLDALWKQRM